MRAITPQEKKRLSYERDRRSRFGQSDKASRRIVPLRKTKARRSYRHAASRIAAEAKDTFDKLADSRADARAAVVDKKRWSKAAGTQLKDVIEAKKEWRVRRFGRKKGAGVSDTKLLIDPEKILNKRSIRLTRR